MELIFAGTKFRGNLISRMAGCRKFRGNLILQMPQDWKKKVDKKAPKNQIQQRNKLLKVKAYDHSLLKLKKTNLTTRQAKQNHQKIMQLI